MNEGSNGDRRENRRQGRFLKEQGMALAAASNPSKIVLAQIQFLRAILSDADGLATTDDAVENFEAVFGDGGKWRGNITRPLALAHAIEKAGVVPSSRPSRHCGYVIQWRIKDRAALEAWLARLMRLAENRKAPAVAPAGANNVATPCGDDRMVSPGWVDERGGI